MSRLATDRGDRTRVNLRSFTLVVLIRVLVGEEGKWYFDLIDGEATATSKKKRSSSTVFTRLKIYVYYLSRSLRLIRAYLDIIFPRAATRWPDFLKGLIYKCCSKMIAKHLKTYCIYTVGLDI